MNEKKIDVINIWCGKKLNKKKRKVLLYQLDA